MCSRSVACFMYYRRTVECGTDDRDALKKKSWRIARNAEWRSCRALSLCPAFSRKSGQAEKSSGSHERLNHHSPPTKKEKGRAVRGDIKSMRPLPLKNHKMYLFHRSLKIEKRKRSKNVWLNIILNIITIINYSSFFSARRPEASLENAKKEIEDW